MEMVPSEISSSPAIMRRAVDFPQPDGPTSTRNSLSLTSIERSLTARTSPEYRFTTLSKSTFATDFLLSIHRAVHPAYYLCGIPCNFGVGGNISCHDSPNHYHCSRA